VHLGVWPQAHAVLGGIGLHALQVALHRVQVNHQCGRVDGLHAVANKRVGIVHGASSGGGFIAEPVNVAS
jgi:hypothetical protein